MFGVGCPEEFRGQLEEVREKGKSRRDLGAERERRADWNKGMRKRITREWRELV